MRRRLPTLARVTERAILQLPASQQRRAQHLVRRRRLNRYLRRQLGARFTPVDPGLNAPPELVAQTSALHEQDVATAADRDGYFAGGYLGMWTILRAVQLRGFDLASATAVLDFGCGAAKNLRLLRRIPGLRLVGTDVNAAQIAWAREHVPGLELHVNDVEPPLAFAPDDTFDFVIAGSVFTHIPLHLQRPWLEEIRRIMQPGGYFFCTVAGAYHIGIQLSPELQQQLRREGQVTLGSDDAGVSHATRMAGSWDVFQTREEVLRSFGEVFEVLAYTAPETGQDHLVLRKRASLQAGPAQRTPGAGS